VRSIIDHSREVEEQGNHEYAIELIRSNIKEYRDCPELREELTGLYYRSEEYRKSIKQSKKYLRKFGPKSSVYQLQTHGYVNLAKTEKADKTLENGLKELPHEGVLYTERGRLSMYKESYEDAIDWFEKGVRNAPNYSGNYYWASKIYLQSTEEIWGLLYGEIFMNLEPFTSRTREISSLLFETLNREIIFHNDTAISVNLCKDANFTISDEDKATYVSYGQDIIEPLYKKALKGIEHLSISNISKFRTEFIELHNNIESKAYADHLVFELHSELISRGFFQAYNYWLFMMGNVDEFKSWESDNSSQWKRFIDWFENYNFKVESTDSYYSRQFR
jgi:tetratricopeptide (TPR) repeat protein